MKLYPRTCHRQGVCIDSILRSPGLVPTAVLGTWNCDQRQAKAQGSLSTPACTTMDQALLVAICMPFLTILSQQKKGEDMPEAISNRT